MKEVLTVITTTFNIVNKKMMMLLWIGFQMDTL